MNNIKQITSYDIKDFDEVFKTVIIDGKLPGRTIKYKIIPKSVLGDSINKFGYCCEPKALNYPIFLTVNGIEKEFQIGKTGMFEIQPEDWQDLNSRNEEDQEKQEAEVYINEIKVPWGESGFRFIIDYIITYDNDWSEEDF
jgi:hypothetical protein